MILEKSTYNPTLPFKSSHFNTIYRTLFHKLEPNYQRERMETADGDFMDLDFTLVDSDRLVVILHGLEGSSQSKYMQALSLVLQQEDFDSVSVNFRGCSGEPNRLLSAYHSGKTEDLAEIFSYLEQHKNYKEYYLVGYSLGGNMALKYLGEGRSDIPGKLAACRQVCKFLGQYVKAYPGWQSLTEVLAEVVHIVFLGDDNNVLKAVCNGIVNTEFH